jgi:hypothetical protein
MNILNIRYKYILIKYILINLNVKQKITRLRDYKTGKF